MNTIDAAVVAKDYAALKTTFSTGWDIVGVGEQRTLAAHFTVRSVADKNDFMVSSFSNDMIPVYKTVLNHLPLTPLENAADTVLRKAIFDYLVEQAQDYSLAAEILAGTRMTDDGVYATAPAQKADLWISVAECFLADDATTESDSAVSKAGICMESISKSDDASLKNLKLRYKTTYARVLDANRKFLNAGILYYELSLQDAVAETLQLLELAATCMVLAPPSGPRDRSLAVIVIDERLEQLGALGTLVRKLQGHQVLVPTDPVLRAFEATLQPHQKALTADNYSVFQKCILQHNLQAASHLYESIYLNHLATKILGVTEEQTTALLDKQANIQYTVDQVDGIIEFREVVEEKSDPVTEFCTLLNGVAADIQALSVSQ